VRGRAERTIFLVIPGDVSGEPDERERMRFPGNSKEKVFAVTFDTAIDRNFHRAQARADLQLLQLSRDQLGK
jgi:hypothetical protein